MGHLEEKISDSELEVLRVLWQSRHPLPLADIRIELERQHKWDSSTIKTLVRRLREKGVIEAEKRGVYYYRALVSQAEYNAWSTQTLIDRLFRGSAQQLVASLVEGDQLSRSDIEQLLEQLGGDHG